jgi:hypothetical protein
MSVVNINHLEKTIYSYLQKISFQTISQYKIRSPNDTIVLNGGVLLQSFVKSKNIIPEIINNENLMSYDINAELLLNSINEENTQAEIDEEIRLKTDLIYDIMIRQVYGKGPFIDLLFINLNRILIQYGYTLNLEGQFNNLFEIPTSSITIDFLNNLYKKFIKFQLTTTYRNPNKYVGRFYLSLIKLSDGSQENLRFFDLTYKINNIRDTTSFAYLCCNNSESDNAYYAIQNGTQDNINLSFFLVDKHLLYSESFYKFITKLHYLGYYSQPETIFKAEKNRERFIYLKNKIYTNGIEPVFRNDRSI